MSKLIEITTGEDEVVSHADWVELNCLIRADRSVSREDLVREVVKAGFTNEDAARNLAEEVFGEIEDRIKVFSKLRSPKLVYPFSLDSRLEVAKYTKSNSKNTDGRVPYLFLMTTSRHTMESRHRSRKGFDPTTIFEQLCQAVLKTFWGGGKGCSTYNIGTARRENSCLTFPLAISELCKEMGEGGGWKHGAKSAGAGDGGVDVVVWRKFQDGRAGSSIGFAQCKTGVNWRQHLGRLRPAGFCGNYMSKPLILEPQNIFMVPHRILHSRWEHRMRESGAMLFDRCRIVEYAQQIDISIINSAKTWLVDALESVGASI